MSVLIAGLGRIGRHILRDLIHRDFPSKIFIHDTNTNLKSICYLLNYDSVYFLKEDRFVCKPGSDFIYDSQTKREIHFISPSEFQGCFVIDSSGSKSLISEFKKLKKRTYITSSPQSKLIDNYIIANVSGKTDGQLISTSICDSTAIAPLIIKIDQLCGITTGSVITMHPWLNYQNLSDNYLASSLDKSQFYSLDILGRKSTENIISKETSCIDALSLAFPDYKNKLHAWSYRVPTPIVSNATISLVLDKEITNASSFIQSLISLPGVARGSDEKTSSDYIGLKAAAALDVHNIFLDKKFLNLKIWYDNEYGYVSQVLNYIYMNEEI